MSEKQPLFAVHTPRLKKNVVMNIPMKDLEEYFQAEMAKGLEKEELTAVYIFPTGVLEDGTANFVYGGAPTQGNYVYPSFGILKEPDFIDKFVSLKKLPGWKSLFKLFESEHNKENYPIYLLGGDAQVQSAFVNLVSMDLLRIYIDSLAASVKGKDKE